jgi:DNA-binding NtrC family response regulator
MKILIIDDDQDILDSIMNLLKPANYNCVTASSPIEGLKLYKKYDFDLVITDLKMDQMDGSILIKKIREIDKEIKIIVISAFCDSDAVHSLLNYKIESFFKKPLNIKEFMNGLFEIERNLITKLNLNLKLYKKNL